MPAAHPSHPTFIQHAIFIWIHDHFSASDQLEELLCSWKKLQSYPAAAGLAHQSCAAAFPTAFECEPLNVLRQSSNNSSSPKKSTLQKMSINKVSDYEVSSFQFMCEGEHPTMLHCGTKWPFCSLCPFPGFLEEDSGKKTTSPAQYKSTTYHATNTTPLSDHHHHHQHWCRGWAQATQ